MPKLCKRIIALVAASCLVLVSCPLAFAEDSYVAQHKPTVWEHIIDSTDSTMRSLFNSVVGVFIGTDYCAFTDSKKHEGTEVVSKEIGSDGEYIFFIRCTGCGKTFAYKGSDAQKQYNDYLHSNNLDNGLAVTPATDDSPSGFVWYPTFDDCSSVELLCNSSQNYASVASLGTYSYDYHIGRTYTYNVESDRTLFSFVSSSTSTSELNYYGVKYNLIVPISGDYYSNLFYTFWSGSQSINEGTDGQFEYNYGKYSFYSCNDNSVISVKIQPNCFGYARKNGSAIIPIPSFSVVPSDPVSTPSVPSTIDINNTTYNITDIDFENRIVHTTENYTIEYGDTEIKIYDGPTEIKVIQYVIENPNPDPDPGPGGDTSDPDPGPGGDTSGGSGCCEQCALLLRQANQYLLQIQSLVDQINDKLGDDGDNYTQGIYNLLIEIKSALENLPTEPHTDYESKLTTICNQLANIWGDLETIKTSLSAVETNTATTNEKLDTVHSDLEAVLAELQTQRGILQQILDTLKKILGHVTAIDENVEDLNTELDSEKFSHTISNKNAKNA